MSNETASFSWRAFVLGVGYGCIVTLIWAAAVFEKRRPPSQEVPEGWQQLQPMTREEFEEWERQLRPKPHIPEA